MRIRYVRHVTVSKEQKIIHAPKQESETTNNTTTSTSKEVAQTQNNESELHNGETDANGKIHRPHYNSTTIVSEIVKKIEPFIADQEGRGKQDSDYLQQVKNGDIKMAIFLICFLS